MAPPAHPWWQTTRSPKQGFVLGGIWLVLALGQWVILALDDDPGLLRVALSVLMTLLGAGYVTTAELLRRRSR